MSPDEVRRAVRAIPPEQAFVWDGTDDDDRPATEEELQAALTKAGRGRGRPAGSGTKEAIAIRLDREVVAAFRAAGPGWQTRVNDALKDWLKTHDARS